jgi:hypothetical protein
MSGSMSLGEKSRAVRRRMPSLILRRTFPHRIHFTDRGIDYFTLPDLKFNGLSHPCVSSVAVTCTRSSVADSTVRRNRRRSTTVSCKNGWPRRRPRSQPSKHHTTSAFPLFPALNTSLRRILFYFQDRLNSTPRMKASVLTHYMPFRMVDFMPPYSLHLSLTLCMSSSYDLSH